ncbi:hypothetical protein DFH07DRAFT_774144 [Mycena maculata]|uniref:Uncharacterized protein n=1 Tax=Mycena maculata TaxID=230809 RepID=A0AAD7NBJ3_9AGAR|nr:hypothetical protein DFH07DRAFT_774144 [Mycena maculata]
MVVTNAQLYIIEVFTEAFFYGLYLGWWFSLFSLDYGRTRKKIPVVLGVVTVLMFIMVTIHMGCVLWQNLTSSAPLLASLKTHEVAAFTNILLGEGILTWWAWAVWGHRYWVIVAPAALLVVGFALSIVMAAGSGKTSAVNNPIFQCFGCGLFS